MSAEDTLEAAGDGDTVDVSVTVEPPEAPEIDHVEDTPPAPPADFRQVAQEVRELELQTIADAGQILAGISSDLRASAQEIRDSVDALGARLASSEETLDDLGRHVDRIAHIGLEQHQESPVEKVQDVPEQPAHRSKFFGGPGF